MKPDTEQAILHDFTYSKLKLTEVIVRLIAIGYSPQEAHDLANEWADGLEDDDRGDAA